MKKILVLLMLFTTTRVGAEEITLVCNVNEKVKEDYREFLDRFEPDWWEEHVAYSIKANKKDPSLPVLRLDDEDAKKRHIETRVSLQLSMYFRGIEVDKDTERKIGNILSQKTSWDRNTLKYQQTQYGTKGFSVKYVSVDRRTLHFSSSYEEHLGNTTRFDGGYGICEMQETVERKF